jgi:hypothetical protein
VFNQDFRDDSTWHDSAFAVEDTAVVKQDFRGFSTWQGSAFASEDTAVVKQDVRNPTGNPFLHAYGPDEGNLEYMDPYQPRNSGEEEDTVRDEQDEQSQATEYDAEDDRHW